MKSPLEYLKFVVVGAAALFLVWKAIPKSYGPKEMQLDRFAALPVVGGGRIKPLDSEARVNLMAISGRQTYRDAEGKTQPAIKWLLEVMTADFEQVPDEAARYKVFNIEDSQLLAALGLEGRKGPFAIEDFRQPLLELQKKKEIEPIRAEARDLFIQMRGFMQLAKGNASKLKVFRIENDQVLGVLNLESRSGFRYSLSEMLPRWGDFLEQEKRVRKVDEKNWDLFDRKVADLSRSVSTYLRLAGLGSMHPIPPFKAGGEWMTFGEAAELNLSGEHPVLTAYVAMFKGYHDHDPEAFNEAVQQYEKYLAKEFRNDQGKAGFEVFFNHFAPFYQCSILYGLIFVLICFSWFGWTEHLQSTAFWLAILVGIVHTLALIYRIYLTGRPPVTNLYSSAVFIGWGCVGLCLLLEWLYHNGLGTLVAAIQGIVTLIIAHNLAASGDTMEVLVAVLDTNFWLATHVVCITLGYTATFVAGFFGIVYVLRGVFTPSLDRETSMNLTKMIYGTVCFATLLSFTGTVLGGIWADQSWGRFWGWDPKENGALIIVLWNALLLHARWGGMAKSRGIALLAIGGNIVTAWSWFGVNMLGVGLHSYGFMPGAVLAMAGFIGSQLLIIGIGCLPDKYWRSLRAQAEAFRPAAMVKPTIQPNGNGTPATAIKPAHGGGRGHKSAKIKVKK